MTTENHERDQSEARKPKIGCGAMMLIALVLMALFIYFYISSLASGFANS